MLKAIQNMRSRPDRLKAHMDAVAITNKMKESNRGKSILTEEELEKTVQCAKETQARKKSYGY